MMKKWGCCLAAAIVLLLAALFYYRLMLEPADYRRAYAAVKPGMDAADVERTFLRLNPKGVWRSTSRQKREAGAMEIGVPTWWEYSIFYDKNGRVTKKIRYID